MSMDDLRVRTMRALFGTPKEPVDPPRVDIDRAIDLVWNEAHRVGFNEAIDAGVAKADWHARIGSTMRWNTVEECDAAVTAARQIAREIGDDLRALRKPEEGATPADLAAATGYDPGRDM